MTPDKIHRIWRGDVRRWHHSQHWQLRESGDTIHRHQWAVGMLGLMLFGDDWTQDDRDAALLHDVTESWTGDPSYEAKRTSDAIHKAHYIAETTTAHRLGLPIGVSDRVKLCDGIDCLLWCKERCPDVYELPEWKEHRRVVLELSEALGVADELETMLKGLRE